MKTETTLYPEWLAIQKKTDHLDEQVIERRSEFLARAATARTYHTGAEYIKNSVEAWIEHGEPDIILTDNRWRSVCLKERDLIVALAVYEYETVIYKKSEL